MIRPRSIKKKLQWWVVIIFVLTGTAGWAGIWGLLYISNTTKAVAGEQVRWAAEVSAVQEEIAVTRQLDRELLLAAAAGDLPAQKAQSEKLSAAWAQIGERIVELRRGGQGAPVVEPLASAHAEVTGALGAVRDATGAGKTIGELRSGAYADYDRRVAELERRAKGNTAGAFGAVKVQTDKLYDWIWVLQAALFALVLLCQVFSAWAGYQLSRSLTGELNGLKESAERISMGDLKSEVKVETADVEIIEVGEALDRLRVSLAKAMDRLAQKRGGGAHHPASG